MAKHLAELETYAADLVKSTPPQSKIEHWMNDVVDFCLQCIVGNSIRPEIEPHIPLRDRGVFLRAVRKLHEIGQIFNQSQLPVFQQNMEVVRRVLSEASAARQRSRWIDHDDANQDVLLPVHSRKAFDADINQGLAESSADRPLALVMVDIDHFKSVNDNHGHPVGDDVLKSVASALHSICGHRAKAYRYGGEELAVLLPNCSLTESMATAERMRTALGTLHFSIPELQVTASFGVAISGLTKRTSEQLIKDADGALYRSKKDGRNRVTAGGTEATVLAEKETGAKPAGDVAAAAARLEFENKRRDFLGSEAGVAACRKSFSDLNDALEAALSSLRAANPSIKVALLADRGSYMLRCEGFTLTLHLILSYANSLENSNLRVALWEGTVARATEMQWEQPSRIGEWKYKYDMSPPNNTGWRRMTDPIQSNESVAEFALATLLNRVAKDKAR